MFSRRRAGDSIMGIYAAPHAHSIAFSAVHIVQRTHARKTGDDYCGPYASAVPGKDLSVRCLNTFFIHALIPVRPHTCAQHKARTIPDPRTFSKLVQSKFQCKGKIMACQQRKTKGPQPQSMHMNYMHMNYIFPTHVHECPTPLYVR